MKGRDLVLARDLFAFAVKDDPARFDEGELLESVIFALLGAGGHAHGNEVFIDERCDPWPGEWSGEHVAVDLGLTVHGGTVDRRHVPEDGPLRLLGFRACGLKIRSPFDGASGPGG
jgi:hypothetical protein